MELKKTTDSLIDIVIKKTIISIQPTKNVPLARVVICNPPKAQVEVQHSDNDQLLIDGPGEYEVENVTISTVASPQADEGIANELYSSIQTIEGSLLVLPSLNIAPSIIVEQFGITDLLFIPVSSIDEESAKMITSILKSFSEVKNVVLICSTTPDPKTFQELTITIHPATSSLKFKEILQNTSDTTSIYSLVA